jgi:hypothetical protein
MTVELSERPIEKGPTTETAELFLNARRAASRARGRGRQRLRRAASRLKALGRCVPLLMRTRCRPRCRPRLQNVGLGRVVRVHSAAARPQERSGEVREVQRHWRSALGARRSDGRPRHQQDMRCVQRQRLDRQVRSALTSGVGGFANARPARLARTPDAHLDARTMDGAVPDGRYGRVSNYGAAVRRPASVQPLNVA